MWIHLRNLTVASMLPTSSFSYFIKILELQIHFKYLFITFPTLTFPSFFLLLIYYLPPDSAEKFTFSKRFLTLIFSHTGHHFNFQDSGFPLLLPSCEMSLLQFHSINLAPKTIVRNNSESFLSYCGICKDWHIVVAQEILVSFLGRNLNITGSQNMF